MRRFLRRLTIQFDVPSAALVLSLLLCFAIRQSAGARQVQSALPEVVLNSGEAEQSSSEGYYTLIWESQGEGGATFELQEARANDFTSFTVRYTGPDRATTVSGRPDGDYYYRVRVIDTATTRTGAWSNTHVVHVRHHGLGRAFAFLTIGAVVFLATTFLVIAGHRRSQAGGYDDAE